MTLKLFRCRICGDPYLGSEPPSFCPFCGAPQKYMVPAADYVDRNDVPNLSALSRANLEKALDLEVRNAAFYMCASNCAPDAPDKAMFKALWRTEAEHASLICKLLKVAKPEIKPDREGLPEGPQGQLRGGPRPGATGGGLLRPGSPGSRRRPGQRGLCRLDGGGDLSHRPVRGQ